MRPLSIKMSAFGPYKDVETIDFSELKTHRLFVISGQTGAGKTSIFDAICFALYGTSSGSDRENAKMLRSDFANDDTHTAVELIFEIRNRKYRVLRQIGHVKEGRKTATGEKYELYEILADGTEQAVVERQRVSDINPKLEEIIGLTYDQFSQIVMLPQGEFRKLLTSPSENKEAILRKIFKTNRYGKMAKLLEVRKQQAEADARTVKAMRDSYMEQIAGVLPQRESALSVVLQNGGNIYQIQEALLEEKVFYEEAYEDAVVQHEQAKKQFDEQNEKYISAKSLNEQLDDLEQTEKYAEQLANQKFQFEQLKQRAEAGQRANTLVFLDQQCKELKKVLTTKEVQVTRVKEDLNRVEQSLVIAKSALDEQKLQEPQRKQWSQSIQKLESMLPMYEQIHNTQQQLKLLQQSSEKYIHQHEIQTKQFIQLQQNLESVRVEIRQLEEEVSKRPLIVEQLHEQKQIVTLFQQYNQQIDFQQKAESEFQQVDNRYNLAKQQLQEAQTNWLNNQAYVLAINLMDGDACPVCGSLEHPNKHIENTSTVNEQQMEQYQAQVSQVEREHNDVQLKYKMANQQVTDLKQQLQKLNVDLAKYSSYVEHYNELEQYNEQLQRQAIQLKQLKNNEQSILQTYKETEVLIKEVETQKITAEKNVIAAQASYEQMKANIDPTISDVQQLKVTLNQQQQQLEQSERALELALQQVQQYETTLATTRQACEFATQQVQETEEQLTNLREQFITKMTNAQFESYGQYQEALLPDSEIKQLEQQYINYTNECHATEQKLQHLSNRLKGSVKVDLSEALVMVQQLKQQQEQIYDQVRKTHHFIEQCVTFHEKLDKVAAQIYELEQTSNQITDVHNLLKGNNAKKISFERYVQMGYLEQITNAANIRLKNLSNGQFMLICSDRQESHGRQSGLSLDVYDSYTGQTRDVKSLSGGEKFNASLCLALGMADVIQNHQGSVKIDTMFIDEGFGSLDEESLMRAIDTLIELQNAGRMIGVISHVSELKDAIPAILQVSKSKAGFSHTKFIVQ